MHFVKSLIYYLSEEVIEMNWIRFTQDLAKAANLEEIIQHHERFLNSCLKESLLTNQQLLQILASDIGNTAQNYFRIKEYLSQIESELDAVKVGVYLCRKRGRSPCKNAGSTCGW
jgi:chemotaxis regulatin CheY-phosphate phosphatase CheZ